MAQIFSGLLQMDCYIWWRRYTRCCLSPPKIGYLVDLQWCVPTLRAFDFPSSWTIRRCASSRPRISSSASLRQSANLPRTPRIACEWRRRGEQMTLARPRMCTFDNRFASERDYRQFENGTSS